MNGDGRVDRLAFNGNKTSPDICGLREESFEEFDNLLDPDVPAKKIVEDLEAALERFSAIAADFTSERDAS